MRLLPRIIISTAILFAAADSSLAARASARRQNARSDQADGWKEFAPAGGGFKVLLPRKPKREEAAASIYAGRWRAENHDEGAGGSVRFQVMYVESGPSAQAESGTPLLQALRLTALNELRGRVLTDAAISFGGRPGRLLEIAVEGAGHARVILVAHGQRAYRLDVTTPGDSEGERAVSAKFFQSFVALPIKAEAPEKASGEVDKLLARESFEVVDGGMLNAKTVKKPAPHYPPAAKMQRASGMVIVKVLVDEEGKVMAAQVVAGHFLLSPPALAAARQARFEPTLVGGKPAKVVGHITYKFNLF